MQQVWDLLLKRGYENHLRREYETAMNHELNDRLHVSRSCDGIPENTFNLSYCFEWNQMRFVTLCRLNGMSADELQTWVNYARWGPTTREPGKYTYYSPSVRSLFALLWFAISGKFMSNGEIDKHMDRNEARRFADSEVLDWVFPHSGDDVHIKVKLFKNGRLDIKGLQPEHTREFERLLEYKRLVRIPQ